MHTDESLPVFRRPLMGDAAADINPPAPAWTKSASAMPGGVPPMFDRAREPVSLADASGQASIAG
jgi:hypothetical protein